MATSVLEQYRIADLLEWYDKKQLVPNPEFQRRSVWSKDAKVFLIDTILRQLPIPKVYMRTKVDLKVKRSYREIVDGQQRLRAIIDFSRDELTLTKRAKQFEGLSYSTLGEELQEIFLSYPISVDQLINASDSDVLEIFARLNSYTVTLNDAERRHANFDTDFRWSVHDTSKKWKVLWEHLQVVTTKQRVRMADDSLMAEMYGIIIQGVTDGGQPRITRLYERHRDGFPNQQNVENAIDAVNSFITENLEEVLIGSIIVRAPHFLMLFAAIAHALIGIPQGEMNGEMPTRSENALSDISKVKENLAVLNSVLESDEPKSKFREFYIASSSSTQRISSRRIRFPMFYKALLPETL